MEITTTLDVLSKFQTSNVKVYIEFGLQLVRDNVALELEKDNLEEYVEFLAERHNGEIIEKNKTLFTFYISIKVSTYQALNFMAFITNTQGLVRTTIHKAKLVSE